MLDMQRMTFIKTIEDYAGEALNGYFYLMKNESETIFAVVSIAQIQEQKIVQAGIVVKLEQSLIIIEKDINNKPLVDALVQNGIPREQIILAYAGEAIPEAG